MTDFTVRVTVPENLQWAEINSNFQFSGIDIEMHPRINAHFAFLLRQAGWQHGIDWQPQENVVVLNVPNTFFTDRIIDESGRYTDGLSQLLLNILKEVDLPTVRRHFVSR